jgi:TonB family protein
MSQSSTFRPDPFDPGPAAGTTPASAGPSELSLADWVSALSEHGGGTLSTDLAVDLVLNEIVERARVTTSATAAAIALLRDGEIVCRATTGENAPGLGVPLNTRSGLSGACVQGKRWQRCDDTETDSRVDRELCRKLGTRSILAVPVLRAEELLGVMEIFSANPNAFAEREIGTLQGCAKEVVATLDRAARIPEKKSEAPLASQPVPAVEEIGTRQPAMIPPPTFSATLAAAEAQAGPRDVWTTVLMLGVIAIAMALGWVVGRAGRRPVGRSAAQQTTQSTAMVGDESSPQPESNSVSNDGASSGGLVVYQDDKVIYPRPSPGHPDGTKPPVEPAAERAAVGGASVVRISADTAKQYILQRVEPEYPAEARAQGLDGSVMLDMLVGKDGTVQKFTAIRGDPQLAAAATTAVRQWRFRPYMQDGRATEFQTRITVDFKVASNQ